jgi:hypothetical protein
MITLDKLTDTACPSCGAAPVYVEKSSQHCSGEWFEWVKFACGFKIHWSPNFSRREVIEACPTTKEFRNKDITERISRIIKSARDNFYDSKYWPVRDKIISYLAKVEKEEQK